jgi:hypothetical protein
MRARKLLLPAVMSAAVMWGGMGMTRGDAGLTLYVAPDGNDGWTGKVAEAQGADGPFATLERARDEIRKVKQEGDLPAGGVVVEVAAGTYECRQTLELTAEDSGTQAAPIIYRAPVGEEVRLTGGRRVSGFAPVTDAAMLARLEEPARGNVLQADLQAQGIEDLGEAVGPGKRLELFFNDTPMTLARWPNEGFVKIVDVVGGEPFDVRGREGDRIGKFTYEGDRPERWTDEKDLWLHGYWFWDWADQRQRVESIDTDNRVITLAEPYHHYGYRKGQWYYALNALAELDMPGEWYLDRETGILYFWPPSPIEEATAVVSVLPTLVTMNDVSHVTLRGFVMEATRGTAVTMSGGTGNRVVACTIRNTGVGAVRVAGGTDNGVVGCDIYDIGAGGIGLSGGDRKSLTPAGHYAENNHVHHYARWKRMYSPAVSLHGVGNRVSHNLMENAPHQAISFGGNDHVIEFNEIHSVCYESNDAGAIYSGRDWTMRGTVIRHNYLHHIKGFRGRGCVGVYLDDMYCGTVIYGNLFYRVVRAAFIGGGRDNTIENNIFVECPRAVHIDNRAMGWASGSVEGTMKKRLEAMPYQEPPWTERYPKLVGIWEDEPAVPKGNVVARNISVGEKWDDISSVAREHTAFEDNLWDEDPHFVDAPNLNFQLRDDSPAYRLGFKRIPIEEIGLHQEADRASWPVHHEVREMDTSEG